MAINCFSLERITEWRETVIGSIHYESLFSSPLVGQEISS